MSRFTRLLGGVALGVGAYVGYSYLTWRPRTLSNLYRDRRLLLGHRGAAAEAPANTVPAFRRAMEAGADGVELDVHLTRDGHAVVIHDETVDSVTGVSGRIREMTLAEVQQLDAGSYFGAEFAGARIPTLDEVLDVVGPQGIVNIELKGTGVENDGLEREVVRVIHAHGMSERVILSSFNPLRLWRLRHLAPYLPRGMLHSPDTPVYVRELWFLPVVQPDAVHPHYSMVNAAYMKRAHQWGVRVNVWTVDDPAQARRLANLGVDAIITNDPAHLREIFK